MKDSELFSASADKKFDELVVLVPFFGANPRQLRRHIQFLNELGFDALLVELSFNLNLNLPPLSSRMAFGLKHVWADQIEKALNSVTGSKVVYAFSNPSASAIEAIARRGGHDVSALICDSGPSKHAFKSIWRLNSQNKILPLLPYSLAKSLLSTAIIGPNFSKELEEALSRLSADLPILSIRGWRDTIIPPSYIDDVFEPHPHLTWQKLSLPEAGHLNGLKDYPEEYEPGVRKFLTERVRHSSL